ncbi:MAG: M48 family metallopeptidase [Planctomycetota bacterium]|nr:M48 family metallopeptidase [Planctomycetota bacterium]
MHDDQEPLKGLPSNVTYSSLIAMNKRNSAFLILLMNVLIAGFGGAVGVILVALGDYSGTPADGQNQGVQVADLVSGFVFGGIFGIVIAIIATIWSWFGGSAAILRMTGAREIVKGDDPQLFNVVEELSIAAGIPMPRVYLIDDPAMNAFATGRDPKNGVVAITAGLRKKLNRDELAGVIAHEISHIRHYDIRLGMLMATLAGIIIFMSDAGTRVAFYSAMFGGGGGRSNRGGGGANPLVIVIVVLAIVFAILAPFCAMVVRFAMSRQREYLADAGAVELTRYPDGLIGALRKLGGHREPLRHVGQSTAPLFIVNPLKRAVRSGRHDASTVFSTHPPLTERIQRLQALK